MPRGVRRDDLTCGENQSPGKDVARSNSLKGVSARRLRSEFTRRVNRASMHGHLWSPSYFAASCGGAPLSIIREYIEQQQRPSFRAGLTPP